MKKLINKIKNGKALKVVNSVLKGALKDPLSIAAGAVVGLNEGLKQVKRESLSDDTGGEGKQNYIRWASFGLMAALIVLFVMGKIDKETLEYLLELVNQE